MISRLQKLIAISVFVLLIASVTIFFQTQTPTNVYAQAIQPTPTSSVNRTVSVSGMGTASVPPDLAVVTLGVQTDAETAAQAMTQNSTQMQAVMAALQKAGVAAADIHTTVIQLYPRYENPPTPSTQSQTQPQPAITGPKVIGYTASNTVEVKVRKLDSIGTLLDQIVSAGGNQIQGIQFQVSDPSQALDQARESAMKDATHKATQLATLAGAHIGQVLTISENSQGPIPFQAPAMAQASVAVPVSPGQTDITVSVQVTWEITP